MNKQVQVEFYKGPKREQKAWRFFTLTDPVKKKKLSEALTFLEYRWWVGPPLVQPLPQIYRIHDRPLFVFSIRTSALAEEKIRCYFFIFEGRLIVFDFTPERGSLEKGPWPQEKYSGKGQLLESFLLAQKGQMGVIPITTQALKFHCQYTLARAAPKSYRPCQRNFQGLADWALRRGFIPYLSWMAPLSSRKF